MDTALVQKLPEQKNSISKKEGLALMPETDTWCKEEEPKDYDDLKMEENENKEKNGLPHEGDGSYYDNIPDNFFFVGGPRGNIHTEYIHHSRDSIRAILLVGSG